MFQGTRVGVGATVRRNVPPLGAHIYAIDRREDGADYDARGGCGLSGPEALAVGKS